MASGTNVFAETAEPKAAESSSARTNSSRRPLSLLGLSTLLFVLGAVSTAGYFAMAPDAGMGPGPESLNVARTLAAQGIFGNPYHSFPTGLTAHVAPLYPFLMATMIRLSGSMFAFSIWLVIWNVIVQGLMIACLPAISEHVFGERKPGIVAAVLFIALPLNLMWAQWDALTVSCGFALLCVATRKLPAASVTADLLTGAAAGVLMLFNPTIIVPIAVWCAFILRRAPLARVTRLAIAGGGILVLTLTPWTIRNYLVLHKLVPLRDNFGLELYVSNRDGAGPTYMENFTLNPNMPHPNSNVEEARLVRQLGEAEYNRNRQSIAQAWITTHRAEFLRLTALRVQRFWFPIREPLPLSSRSVWTVTVLSWIGLALLAIRGNPSLWVFFAAPALYALPYYLTNNDARYRYPVLWITVLCAGYAISRVLPRRLAFDK
ncbi:MAG: hypothetical protein ABL995_04070 [Bryobacteraceae bacterium]